MQMFSNLISRAGSMCCGNKIVLLGKQKMFLHGVKNTFASRTRILRPKHIFPSLATPRNITRNIVSATMFPSLARPLEHVFFLVKVNSLFTRLNFFLRVPIHFLLVNMAVADIFYAANHIGGMIFRHISKPEVMPEKVFCFLSQAHLQWIGTTCSTLTLILIAVERYFAVVHPYECDTKLTIRKVKVCFANMGSV